MQITLRYDDTPQLNIKSISVIGSFNNYDAKRGKMKLIQEKWTYNIDLKKGEYLYRFVINDTLELIDPEAGLFYADKEDKIWSMLVIDNNDKRLYNPNQSSLNIENYYIYSKTTDEKPTENKKQFNITYDKQVCTMFEITDIIGTHHTSIVWISPFNTIIKIEEYPIYINYEKEPNKTSISSILSLETHWEEYPKKGWKIRLFVNGDFILEDEFEIHSTSEYSFLRKYK